MIHALVAAYLVLVGLDALLHRHSVHPWEGLFGFYALYGFAACVLLVLLAKELRKLLMRGEDYSSGNRRACGRGDGDRRRGDPDD